MSPESTEVRFVVAWLPPVRWATCGVLWSVAAVAWLQPSVGLSVRTLLGLVVTVAVCRTVVSLFARHPQSAATTALGFAACAEAALMTGLLDVTGGLFNPFLVVFAVYVWFAAVALSPRWAAVVSLVAIGGFATLVHDHEHAELALHHRLADFPTHLFTMCMAGAAVTELVAHYVARARTALAQRQHELDLARVRALRSEHIAALTTLAAGAAHELSTPLSTIAVAARELERNTTRLAETRPETVSLKDDACLIRAEVDRCQLILDGMSGRARNGVSFAGEPLAPSTIASRVRARLSHDQQSRMRVDMGPDTCIPSAPGDGLVQAISALLKNAFDASPSESTVCLRFEQRDAALRVEVRDSGSGMSAEDLRHVGEPFYTTKLVGQGMGLGLFLTRAVVEQSGGTLHFDVSRGTTAVLEVPATSIHTQACL